MIDFVLVVKIDNDNRIRLLEQTLNSLFKNTELSNINSLTVVNDNSFYDISGITKYSPVDVNLINLSKTSGVGKSKNIGVEFSKYMHNGKYLYLLDGDVYFTDKWDIKMIEIYEKYKDEFKIIAGGIHPYLQNRIGEDNLDLTSHDALSGWSWLLDYDTWDKFGKLADNSIGTGKSEDWEYCQRIRNAGYKVGCLKNQVIAHCGITNTEGEKIPGYDESVRLAKSISSELELI
jgi:hypothetical protein